MLSLFLLWLWKDPKIISRMRRHNLIGAKQMIRLWYADKHRMIESEGNDNGIIWGTVL